MAGPQSGSEVAGKLEVVSLIFEQTVGPLFISEVKSLN